ncbi:hypothetical protein VNO78_25959 [Psophocarpus tetragonolobus]|uniref:TMV resistance protein N n=1 Tax=Psophocarpus tetragonolobus TaxID=3891 RepID=A0AAN9XFT4_PSOTE
MRYFREGLCKAAGIRQFEVINFREMEMSNNGIDLLLNHWRKALCEATGISGVAGLNYSKVEMEMANNEIDLLMKYWRESLLEAADMSRGKVNMEKYPCVKQWAEALHEAASISGVVVLNTRNEAEAIKNIVENVTHSLDKTELFVANNPVGVEARVQEMIQLISKKASKDVLLLGIWGMGGIGKTTIAKAIYNKIGRNFEGRSFLANIREIWEQDAGQVSLQEQLLFDIYRETTTKIHNVEYGKNILQTRFCYKKVLIVLDDVNKLDQLNALCGSDKWFGRGSRIVITTRDKHIIRGNRVHKVHIMKEMDERESTELFSWNAFKQASPKEGFTELSKSVVSYCGGLPLALEVLGCYLFDMSITEWESVLEKLKRIPNDQVQKKLKISYDGLSDDTEKEIFLDIACFFIGMDRYDVIQILNGCRLYAENGIRVLVERSLVTINDKNKLGMHDLLRDMGREIIRAKSPMEPEKRSRLWFHDDVVDILLKKKGTNSIEGLTLMLSTTNSKCVSTTAFKKMKKLRLLQLVGVQLDGDFKHLSRDLRWLCWNGFSLKCIPTNLYRSSLVSIELENSNIKFIWKEAQFMENLKILNLTTNYKELESTATASQNMTTSECDGGLLLGDNDHDWFTFNCDGSSVIFDVPRVNGYNLKAIMCVVHYFNPENVTSDGLKNVLVINHSKLTIQLFKRDTLASFENEEWHRLASNIEPGNHMEVVVVFENGFIVKKTTVYLIYDKPIDKKIEYCHSSNKTVVSSGNEDTSTVGWISPQVESIDDFQHTQKRRKFD